MQIVGKLKKLKSRKPLILLDLRLVIQVVLPLGSGGTPVQVQVLSPAPNSINPNLLVVGDGFGFIISVAYPNFNSKK